MFAIVIFPIEISLLIASMIHSLGMLPESTNCCYTAGVGQDHVQQFLLTLHSFHCGIEKRNTWPEQMVVYFDLFRSCLQSISYILVETVLRPAAPRHYHGY